MRRQVLVTGANGFVGSAVCRALEARGVPVVPVTRSRGPGRVSIGGIDSRTSWREALAGVSTIVHCAARVHMMRDADANPLEAFREVNARGTLNLARQAAGEGVRRIVFVSSIKVNGEETPGATAYRADDAPCPQGGYAVSKLEAEQGLAQIAADTGLEYCVVRPPLVYGPGVKANFGGLMKLVRLGVPLPFGSIRDNRRSLIALDNLADLLATCVTAPAAAGQTFLASDDDDVSTAALILRLAAAMGKQARLVRIPPTTLQVLAHACGRPEVAKRLLGSLRVDIAHTKARLQWQPPLSMDEGLRRATRDISHASSG